MRCFRLATTWIVSLPGIALMAVAQPLLARTAPVGNYAQTIAVGKCRPHLVSYPTISAAVAAAVPNALVLVCPGTYPEQVTITTPLTLEGIKDATGTYPIITVPNGNWPNGLTQLSVLHTPLYGAPTVNISNLVIDGSNSGVTCGSGVGLTGLAYEDADGALENLEVRNQNPGGCGNGVGLSGGNIARNTVNVKECNIHDFDNTGIGVISTRAQPFSVNVNSSFVGSESATAQAGINYFLVSGGTVSQNVIVVPTAQDGLRLETYYDGQIEGNTIIGANIGIEVDSDSSATITKNNLSNNGTGISLSPYSGYYTVSWNTITLSGTAAINLNNCPAQSETALVEYNTIFGAPVSIANVSSGDTLKQNIIEDAGAPTTCP